MVRTVEHFVYAIHEYELPGKGFLPLQTGDLLYVLDADDSGWWLGLNLRGQKGVFPSTYTLPFTFPAPATELLQEMRLISLARNFGVDLATGVPLRHFKMDGTASGVARSPMPSITGSDSADTNKLYSRLNDLVTSREAARRVVVDVLIELRDLRSAEEEGGAPSKALASDTKEEEEAAKSAPATAAYMDAKADLDKVMNRIVEELEEAMRQRRFPSQDWYAAYHSLCLSASADQDLDSLLRRQLKGLTATVSQQEKYLEELNSIYHEEKAAFQHEREALVRRIDDRDELVRTLLIYWSDAAHTAQQDYIEHKTSESAALQALNEEIHSLESQIQERQSHYDTLQSEYTTTRHEAKRLSRALLRTDILDDISGKIEKVDKKIIDAQQSQAAPTLVNPS